jgi:hypothetical protein
MSAVKPASVNAFWRAGRSPFSQRGDDAVSGRITQARFEVVDPPEAVVVLEQPASNIADAAKATTIEIDEDFFMSLPFYKGDTP